MDVDVFNPEVTCVRASLAYNVIKLTDGSNGQLSIFVNADWSDWDRLVRDVDSCRDSFRENQEA